jgi:hypothetical protein
VLAHDLVHIFNKSKEPGLRLKLDYKKAYDRVNLEFLFEILSPWVLVRDGHDLDTKLSKRWLCRGQSEWGGELLL